VTRDALELYNNKNIHNVLLKIGHPIFRIKGLDSIFFGQLSQNE